MKYVGGKSKQAKHILPIILKDRKEAQYYVEPFAGGFNMITKVDGLRIANDINEYVIALFKAIQDGWTPPDSITEEEYKEIKNNKDAFPKHLVAFVGFACSFGGKFFGGYARTSKGNATKKRNYALESKKNILSNIDNLKDLIIENKDYRELVIPSNSIVYCDPPYDKAIGYGVEFNSEEFWEWVRKLVKDGHTVFISEYSAPDDFIVVWEKEYASSLDLNTGGKRNTEKLFIYNKECEIEKKDNEATKICEDIS